MPSLMNGLSQMGQGIAQFAGSAGLEQQKSALQQESIALSASLEHANRSSEIAQQGTIQSGIVGQQTTAQKDIAAMDAASRERTAGISAGATLGAATIAAKSRLQEELIRANAPPDVVKIIKYFGGINADGSSPAAPGGTSGAPSTPPADGASNPSSSAAPATQPQGRNSSLAQDVLNKVLFGTTPGSDAAIRAAIAKDVNNDPGFANSTPGEKAAEVETRAAVAAGKMTDPASRHEMAVAIAAYRLPPLTGYALTKAGGPETMAEAAKLNPDYQAARYPEISKTVDAFAIGKQGDIVRSLNVGVQHLDVFDEAAKALANHDMKALNYVENRFKEQLGYAEPITVDALKQIVGTEVEKAVSGGIGAVSDRDRLMAALNAANSPSQIAAVTGSFRKLMVGQLAGLKAQYEDGTGFKSGPFAFESKLVPETATALKATSPAPIDPDDRKLGASYLLPNGHVGTWAGSGWQVGH